MEEKGKFVILIGASAGGMWAIARLLTDLPTDIPAAIAVVIHTSRAEDNNLFLSRLQKNTAMPCHLASDYIPLRAGHVYFAPANYHTLIKKNELKEIIFGFQETESD